MSLIVKPSGNGSSASSTQVLNPVIQARPLMVGTTPVRSPICTVRISSPV